MTVHEFTTSRPSQLEHMDAYQLVAPSTFERVRLHAVDPAALTSGEVLVRMIAGSVCGSDSPRFRRGTADDGTTPLPGYPLHEIVGDVVASASPGLEPGDHVVGWASAADGLAELVVTEGEGLIRCDPNLPPEEAIVAQPLACVLFAVARLANVQDADVAVIGLGPIGLLFSHVLSSQGARSVTGVDAVDRSDVAADFGITNFVHKTSADWANDIAAEERPTIIIEAVGHQPGTLQDALKAVAHLGTIYCFGIPDHGDYPINVTTVVRKNLTIIGGITEGRRAVLEDATRYLAEHSGLARRLITNVLPASAVQEAYNLASVPEPGRLKVVLSGGFGAES